MPFIRIGILINAFCICCVIRSNYFRIIVCRVCAARKCFFPFFRSFVLFSLFNSFFLYIFCCCCCCTQKKACNAADFLHFGSARLRSSGITCGCCWWWWGRSQKYIFKSFIIVIHVTIKTAGQLFKFDFNFRSFSSWSFFFALVRQTHQRSSSCIQCVFYTSVWARQKTTNTKKSAYPSRNSHKWIGYLRDILRFSSISSSEWFPFSFIPFYFSSASFLCAFILLSPSIWFACVRMSHKHIGPHM